MKWMDLWSIKINSVKVLMTVFISTCNTEQEQPKCSAASTQSSHLCSQELWPSCCCPRFQGSQPQGTHSLVRVTNIFFDNLKNYTHINRDNYLKRKYGKTFNRRTWFSVASLKYHLHWNIDQEVGEVVVRFIPWPRTSPWDKGERRWFSKSLKDEFVRYGVKDEC